MKKLFLIVTILGFIVKPGLSNNGPVNDQARDSQTIDRAGERVARTHGQTWEGQAAISTSIASWGDEVPCDVVSAFKKDFSSASDVKWSDKTFFFEVEFTYDERRVFAFYSLEGKFMGLYHHISSTELPEYLRKSIMENHPGYWITELFKSSRKSGNSYYLTLQNADDKIMFRSHEGADWKMINYQF
jgi:hypothetical protein